MYSIIDLQKLVQMLSFLGISPGSGAPVHSVVFGGGTYALPGASGSLLASNGASADPSFQSLAALGIQPAGTYAPLPLPANSVGASQIVNGSIADIEISVSAAIQSSKLSYNQGGTGAVARTVQNKLDESISANDFGATGDGITDDTAAIQAAEDAAFAAGKNLYFPPGIYVIDNVGITKRSGVSWLGSGKKLSVLKATAGAWGNSLVAGGVITGASILHMGFDFSAATFAAFLRNIHFTTFSYGEIAHCDFVQHAIGFQCDGGTYFAIHHNTIRQLTVYGTTINEGIFVTANTSTPQYYLATDNILTNTGTDFSGSDAVIARNIISGWGYGSGVTIEQGATRLLIDSNRCSFSTGLDANGYAPGGIENWASFSTVTNNECHYNAGAGIHSGGAACVISNNSCLKNGQYSGAGATAAYRVGIISRYVSSSFNGNTSVVSDNLCSDTGGGTQLYGYADDGGNCSGITLTNNLLIGATGPMNATGIRYDFKGPKLQAIVSGQSGFTLANAVSGGGNSGFTMSGAQLGDKVTISINQNMQGLIPFGWVTAAGTVAWSFLNMTGASVTIPNFTLYVAVEKPFNYANY